MTKIYHSREDRIGDLHDEDERVQYDGNDIARIDDLRDLVDEYADKLFESLGDYIDTLKEEVDEDTASKIRYARRELIETWALAQGMLSKVAWVLRVDGNTAYERMIEAIKTGNAMDMRDL